MILAKVHRGRPLVPLPYLLFLASFNFNANKWEASNVLAEGDASHKRIRFKVASEQETGTRLCFQLVPSFTSTVHFYDQWDVSNSDLTDFKDFFHFITRFLYAVNIFFSCSLIQLAHCSTRLETVLSAAFCIRPTSSTHANRFGTLNGQLELKLVFARFVKKQPFQAFCLCKAEHIFARVFLSTLIKLYIRATMFLHAAPRWCCTSAHISSNDQINFLQISFWRTLPDSTVTLTELSQVRWTHCPRAM